MNLNTLRAARAPAHWSSGYVGIPYVEGGRDLAGFDCWGLFRAVYRGECGIDLPDHGISPNDIAAIGAQVGAAIAAGEWVQVDEPRPFDGALFSRGAFDSHVGVMIDPLQMLHADRPAGVSRIERIDTSRWATNFAGFYRHRTRA